MLIRKKAADKDFDQSKLPQNRRQQFFDIIKIRYKLLFVIGLILFAAALPTLVTMLFREMNVTAIKSNYISVTDQEKLKECVLLVRHSNNLYNLILLPSFIILSVILAGIFRIFRQLTLEKGFDPVEEFKIGVKQNVGHFIAIAVVLWFLYFLSMMTVNSGLDMSIAQYLTMGFYIVLIIPVSLIAMSIITMYNMKFGARFTATFLFYFKGFFKYALVILAMALPLAIFLIPNYLIAYMVYSVFFIFYYPLVLLGDNTISISLFDIHINKEKYPDYYHKGLN